MNKKIFLTLFVFIGFGLFFNISNSFASYDITYNGEVYSLPDLPEPIDEDRYCFISSNFEYLNYSGGRKAITFNYYCSDTPITLATYDGKYTAIHGTNITGYRYFYGISSAWSDGSDYGTSVSCYLGTVDGSERYQVITNHGITVDGSDITVFQAAPLEGEQTSTTILPTMITSQDLSGVTREILELLPMLLVILITLLGLMKAIRLLYRVLVQS